MPPSIILCSLVSLGLGLFGFCSIFGTARECFRSGLEVFLIRFLFGGMMIGWVCWVDLREMNKIRMFQYEMDLIKKAIQ